MRRDIGRRDLPSNEPPVECPPIREVPSRTYSDSAVLGRLLALCWRQRTLCVQVIVSQVVLLSFGLAGLSFTGLGFDYLRFVLEPGAPAPKWPLGLVPPIGTVPMQVIAWVALAVMIFALLRGAITWLAGVLLGRLVHRNVVSELQNTVFAKLQHLNFGYFDQLSRGAIINRATGDIQAIRTFVDTILIQALVTLISLAVYVAYMASIHVALTLACLATVPAMWVACSVFSRTVYPHYQRTRTLFDRMILTLAESVEGIGVIKGFARVREATERFRDHNQQVKDQQRQIFLHISLFTPAINMLTHINLIVLLLYGGWLVMHGKLPLGTGLVVFAGLLHLLTNQVNVIAQIANGVQESLSGARRVFEILDTPPGLPLPTHPVVLARRGKSVEFSRVSFGYAPGNLVLRQIDLKVAPGECVAIVGEMGSGKSALLNLIPRFYDTTAGSVRIDGHDVRSLDLSTLRRHVRLVFQESFLFSASVADNICFGEPDAPRKAVVAAAKSAQAHNFIEALPLGYDTVLGESGVDLSGGQRQRLAIARALLTDPAILLLDDPTAAIDPETEHEILTALAQASEGRTTFIVAHRLSTLRRADRIIVLERGRIVQMGTHAELLKEAGAYRSAALHQMIDEESQRLLAKEFEPARESIVGSRTRRRDDVIEEVNA